MLLRGRLWKDSRVDEVESAGWEIRKYEEKIIKTILRGREVSLRYGIILS